MLYKEKPMKMDLFMKKAVLGVIHKHAAIRGRNDDDINTSE